LASDVNHKSGFYLVFITLNFLSLNWHLKSLYSVYKLWYLKILIGTLN
jgi:hypothetical protein